MNYKKSNERQNIQNETIKRELQIKEEIIKPTIERSNQRLNKQMKVDIFYQLTTDFVINL